MKVNQTDGSVRDEVYLMGVIASLVNGLPVDVKRISNYIGGSTNAWNNAAVSAGGVSGAADFQFCSVASLFGNANAATTITVQFSNDGITYYDTTYSQVLAAAGNFGFTVSIGARYLRLKSSAAATITAGVAGKT